LLLLIKLNTTFPPVCRAISEHRNRTQQKLENVKGISRGIFP
jgi:hypothetical protein